VLAEGLTPEPWWLRCLPIGSSPCDLGLFNEVGAKLLVEIESEGGRRHNSPLIVTLPPLLSRSYLHYYRRGEEIRKYLTEKEMQQGDTWQTERLVADFGALFSLQCARSITRGSLFIGVPWLWSFASITPFSFLTNGFKHFTRAKQ
jgi:hypothetical protein